MDELLGGILLGVPEGTANLQLPDPTLRDYYRDEENRVFWLDGDVDENTLDLVKMIIKCNKEDKGLPTESRKPIRIMIDSGGGEVQVMLTIIKAMKMSKTPIYTIVYCYAMSAAAQILAAGHRRYALPGTCVMVHSGSAGVSGTMEQVESQKKYVDALTKRSNEAFVESTSIDAKTLKKKGMVDWFMEEQEALKWGIVDKIVEDFDELF